MTYRAFLTALILLMGTVLVMFSMGLMETSSGVSNEEIILAMFEMIILAGLYVIGGLIMLPELRDWLLQPIERQLAASSQKLLEKLTGIEGDLARMDDELSYVSNDRDEILEKLTRLLEAQASPKRRRFW